MIGFFRTRFHIPIKFYLTLIMYENQTPLFGAADQIAAIEKTHPEPSRPSRRRQPKRLQLLGIRETLPQREEII